MMIYSSEDNFVSDNYISFENSNDFLDYLSSCFVPGMFAIKISCGDMFRFVINIDYSVDVFRFSNLSNADLLETEPLMSFIDFETFYSLYNNF